MLFIYVFIFLVVKINKYHQNVLIYLFTFLVHVWSYYEWFVVYLLFVGLCNF